MAKAPGRLAVLSKNAVAIGGITSMSIKWSGDPIDVTDKDSNGLVELMSVVASQSITLSVEGVYKDPVLRDVALTPATSKLLTDLTFKFSDALAAVDTLGGSFFMTNYEEGNPHDGATDFSCEFTSSGTWTLA